MTKGVRSPSDMVSSTPPRGPAVPSPPGDTESDAMGAGAGEPAGGAGDSRLPPGNPVLRLLRRIGHRRLLVGGVLAALAARLPLLSHESLDFATALTDWHDFIAANGHFAALRYDFSDYSPAYLYLLTAAVYLLSAFPKVIAVKAASIPFDFLIAFFVHRCVAIRYPHAKEIPALAAIAALFTPTVLLNSALWGQVDAGYTAFLVACLYGFLAGRRTAAFVAFGLAFAFKAPAAFLAPLLLGLLRRRAASPGDFGRSALVYALTLVPAVLLGRPLGELLSTYFSQVGSYGRLTMDAANLYQWVPDGLEASWYPLWPVGAALAVAVVWGISTLVARSRAEITPDRIALLAAFSVLVVPFFLPKMLDRYFFPAEVFAVVLAFWRPRRWFAPVVLGFAGLNVYWVNGIRFESPFVPYSWAAAGLLFVIAVLFRDLLREFGYPVRLRDFPAAVGRGLRRRGAAAAPFLLLAAALGAVLWFGGAAGRFSRPVGEDRETAGALARAANRSADPTGNHFSPTAFSGYTRRTLDREGAVAYEFEGPVPPPAGHLLLGFVVGHFGDEFPGQLAAQRTAARALMAVFFCLAALLAALSLSRLLGNRWLGAGAALLACSSFLGGDYDRVSLESAPALFGFFLAFHGLVLFAAGGEANGRLRPALLRCGAGLLFGLEALALVVPFVVFRLFAEGRRRRKGAEGPPGPVDSGAAGSRNRTLALGAFAVLFGGAVFGVGALSREALPRYEADAPLPVSAAVLASGGVNGSATGGPTLSVSAAAGGSGAIGGGVSNGIGEAPAAAPASFPEVSLRSIGRVLLPYGWGEPGLAVAGIAALAALVLAALSRFRLLLLPPALAGWVLSLVGVGSGAVLLLGVPLVLWTVAAGALRRLPTPAAGPVFLVLAAALFVGSGRRAARAPIPAESPAGVVSAEAGVVFADAGAGEDLRRIRRTLRRRIWRRPDGPGRFSSRTPRPGGGRLRVEEQTVFVPTGSLPAASWYFAGSIVVDREEQRPFAGFVVSAERAPGRGLLTPGNERVFLHHRAAFDGEARALIEAAGPPLAGSRFEIHLDRGPDRGRLLYVREECRPEDFAGRFFLHLMPSDERDLPPYRRPFGFDNLDFRFRDRLVVEEGEGGRCVAAVRLPDYPIRAVATGQFRRRADNSPEEVWRVRFAPGVVVGDPR